MLKIIRDFPNIWKWQNRLSIKSTVQTFSNEHLQDKSSDSTDPLDKII